VRDPLVPLFDLTISEESSLSLMDDAPSYIRDTSLLCTFVSQVCLHLHVNLYFAGYCEKRRCGVLCPSVTLEHLAKVNGWREMLFGRDHLEREAKGPCPQDTKVALLCLAHAVCYKFVQ